MTTSWLSPACLCLLAACASAPAPEPAAAPPATSQPAAAAPAAAAPAASTVASPAKGPPRVVNQQVELCARAGQDGAMSLAASFGPGCEPTTLSCQARPLVGGSPVTALDVEVKVGPVPSTGCPRPTVVASATCPLPSHADPKAGPADAVQVSDLPQQSQVPLRVNGAELGQLATDEFARPRPGQCWRMPLAGR